MGITTTCNLLTGNWTADAERVTAAIGRFTLPRGSANACRVSLFEIARDGDLHVNVTHRHETRAVKGWTGPGVVPEGFVHNRRFSHQPAAEIVRHIREMVFAAGV